LNAIGAAENNNLIQAQAPAKIADFVNDARRPRGRHLFADEVAAVGCGVFGCLSH
jgi:hypothetical protein